MLRDRSTDPARPPRVALRTVDDADRIARLSGSRVGARENAPAWRCPLTTGITTAATSSTAGSPTVFVSRSIASTEGGCFELGQGVVTARYRDRAGRWLRRLEVGGDWPRLIHVAEVVAEDGGELLFGARSVSEHGEGRWRVLVGEVVTFGPVMPGHESVDVDPLFADGRQHGVEEVDGVAVAELFVCVMLGGGCVHVAFDGGSGPMAGSFEVGLGPLELVLGDVEYVPGRAPLQAWGGGESVFGGGVYRRASTARASAWCRASRSAAVAAATSARTVSARSAAAVAWARRAAAAPRVSVRRAGRVGRRRGRSGTSRGSATRHRRRAAGVTVVGWCGRGCGVGWWRGRRRGRWRGWSRGRRELRRCRRCR